MQTCPSGGQPPLGQHHDSGKRLKLWALAEVMFSRKRDIYCEDTYVWSTGVINYSVVDRMR